ncbi:MAG TPA: MBL fold metallo-hydrolase [Fimbriimonadaceae bacterium]|nr:MBL fold metallo-hydrolase [Fimbriimonadaceae bacterium]
MILRKFYHEGLAQASYLVGCPGTGEAIVIDANRDLAQYHEVAEREGLRIVAVTETHIHADYVSGSKELAEQTGATLFLTSLGGPDWQYAFAGTPLVDGSEIRAGAVRLVAKHTPGHTPEHLMFLLYEGDNSEPVGAFTGDFVFVGDVGRPDLLEKATGLANTMEAGAERLFDSLEAFKRLPAAMLIWPAHGSGSACGKALGGVPESTLGYELQHNPGLRFTKKADFVAWVLDGQPEPPMYFANMKSVNKLGPAPRPASLKRLGVSRLQALLASETYVIDLRPRRWVQGEAIGRALSIPNGRSLTAWAGSLLTPHDSFVLLARDAREAEQSAMDLALIGLDGVIGWIQVEAALDEATRLGLVAPLDLPDLNRTLIDVRKSTERDEKHIIGSVHLPISRMVEQLAKLDPSKPYTVHCQGGGRAHVAASYLKRLGYDCCAFVEPIDKLAEDLKQRA